MFKLIIFENYPNVEGRNYLKLSTLVVYTFELSDILSDLFISNSTLFIVLPIGSILILKVNVSGSFYWLLGLVMNYIKASFSTA